MTVKPGPAYRDCQLCWTKPACGTIVVKRIVARRLVTTSKHVCMYCADSDTFEPYEPTCPVCTGVHSGSLCGTHTLKRWNGL